jgi:DNA-directed RNA polymerase subunit beta
MEFYAALDSGQVMVAEGEWRSHFCDRQGNLVHVKERGGVRTYPLRKYQRSNQSTCIDQRPAVVKGQIIKKGDIIADSSSTDKRSAGPRSERVVAFPLVGRRQL